MAFTLNLGFDRGNARTNVASIQPDGTFVEIDASSMIAEANIARMKTINDGAGMVADDEKMVLEQDGISYIFSDYAIAQGINPTTGFGDTDRYHGAHTKRSIMAYSSLMASKLATPKYGMPTELVVTLVMGVPVQYYREESVNVKVAFEGKTFHYKFNGRDVSISIPSVRVFMEGAGAAICKGLHTTGYIGIVDTGSFTTNALVFDGMKPVQELCHSYEVGIGTALKRVSDRFENKYHRALEDQEGEQLLRASIGFANPPLIYADAGEVSYAELNSWLSQALQETATDIYTRISGNWKSKRSQFRTTLHVGGGSLYLHNHFQEVFKRAERPTDAEKYNARGYAILGNQIAERNKIHLVRGA